MTKEELVRKLKELESRCTGGTNNLENIHLEADGLLLNFIDDDAVSEAFLEVPKWYS